MDNIKKTEQSQNFKSETIISLIIIIIYLNLNMVYENKF